MIVPFLGRDMRMPSPRYPHLVKSPECGELLIALGKEDKSKELKDAIERAQAQELERLLYVATTRARHTLVLVLDQDIFATTPGHLPKTAQLRRLIRGGDVYTGDFDAHTTLADEGADAIEPGKPSTPEEGVATLARLDRRDLKRAANRAVRVHS